MFEARTVCSMRGLLDQFTYTFFSACKHLGLQELPGSSRPFLYQYSDGMWRG